MIPVIKPLVFEKKDTNSYVSYCLGYTFMILEYKNKECGLLITDATPKKELIPEKIYARKELAEVAANIWLDSRIQEIVISCV